MHLASLSDEQLATYDKLLTELRELLPVLRQNKIRPANASRALEIGAKRKLPLNFR